MSAKSNTDVLANLGNLMRRQALDHAEMVLDLWDGEVAEYYAGRDTAASIIVDDIVYDGPARVAHGK